MNWPRRDWPERRPRPKAAKLDSEAFNRLHARATAFVEQSVVLRDLLNSVQAARGRLYFWREPEDLMARVTPLAPRSLLLEAPRGDTWIEVRRGQLATLLKAIETDVRGTFHGLGILAGPAPTGDPPALVVLHRDLGIPLRVLAEPRYWHAMHREPSIAEVSAAKDRVLVNFVASSFSSSFGGTCLYALREGIWGCYTVRPNASGTLADAEAWLEKRSWKDWG